MVWATGFHELLHKVRKQVSDILIVGQLGGHIHQPPGPGFHLQKDTEFSPEGTLISFKSWRLSFSKSTSLSSTQESTTPRVQFGIMNSAQKAKSQKLRDCSFFLTCPKVIVGKEGNGCIVPGQSLKQEEVLLDVVDQGVLHFLYHLEDSLKVIRLSPVALEGDASFGAYVPQFWWCMEQVLKHMEITVVVHGVALEHRCCGPGLLQDSPASTPSGPPHCSPNHHPARGDTHPG